MTGRPGRLRRIFWHILGRYHEARAARALATSVRHAEAAAKLTSRLAGVRK